MRRQLALFVGLAMALSTPGAERKLELRGQIEPRPEQYASVTLHGSDFPFNAQTLSDSKGRFRFRKVDPGLYTVIVFLPGRGTVRRTIVVSESLADEEGRVTIMFPYQPAGESLEASGTVSVRELSIPGKARKEYSRAQKALNKRDIESAIGHLEKAVEIAPNFVSAWNNLGTIAYQTARYADAERYFRTALRYEPGAYTPVVNLGGALLSLRQYDEALKYIEDSAFGFPVANLRTPAPVDKAKTDFSSASMRVVASPADPDRELSYAKALRWLAKMRVQQEYKDALSPVFEILHHERRGYRYAAPDKTVAAVSADDTLKTLMA